MQCWERAMKDLGWDYGSSMNVQQITARYDACKSTPLVHPGGTFVASCLLLIKRVTGGANEADKAHGFGPVVVHALRTLPQKGDKWMVKGWNNSFFNGPDGEEIDFLEYMSFKEGKWKTNANPGTYEIKLLTKKDVPKAGM